MSKPLDPSEFIAEVRTELREELQALHRVLRDLPWLEIKDRGKRGAIKLTPLDLQPEPQNIPRLKREVKGRWGIVALIDMLKRRSSAPVA